jgi:hypothetical protein
MQHHPHFHEELMKFFRALMVAAPVMLLPAVSQAQVAYNYLNISCLWNPNSHEYSITIHRNPGQTLVHTIVDQNITNVACTSDVLDLMNWVQQELQTNGTWNISLQPSGAWGLSNDQIEHAYDVFCPDLNGIENPSSIGSMIGTVYPPISSGGNFQAAMALNYSCPSTPYTVGNSGYTPISATYAVTPCQGYKQIGKVYPRDNESARMLNIGSSGGGVDDWYINFMDGSGPLQTSSTISGTPHCDPSLRTLAENYLASNAALATSALATSQHLACGSRETMAFYINTCEELGDDSSYGYEVGCCPNPVPAGSEGTNCHSMCLPISVADVTHFYGPTTPLYTDPTTVCADLAADTAAWMDSAPCGGPTQPWICGPNWGAAAGGFYVPGTLVMSPCSVVNASDPTCLGNPRVNMCLTYTCQREQ